VGASRSEEARRTNRIARDDDDDDDDDDNDDDWLRLMEDGWSTVVDADEMCVLIGARCPLKNLFLFAYAAQSSLTLTISPTSNSSIHFLPVHANFKYSTL